METQAGRERLSSTHVFLSNGDRTRGRRVGMCACVGVLESCVRVCRSERACGCARASVCEGVGVCVCVGMYSGCLFLAESDDSFSGGLLPPN